MWLFLIGLIIISAGNSDGLPSTCTFNYNAALGIVGMKTPCQCNGSSIPSNYDGQFSAMNLNSVNLSGCNFSGTILDRFHPYAPLSLLDLSGNSFTGLFPPSFASHYFPTFRTLDLSNNNFSGPISSVPFAAGFLKYINLANNSFSGPIKPLLDALPLTNYFFSVEGNNFSGDLPNIKPFYINSNGLNSDGTHQLKCIIYNSTETLPAWCKNMNNDCYCRGVCGNGIKDADEDCLTGPCCDNCRFASNFTLCGNTSNACTGYFCTGFSDQCPTTGSRYLPGTYVCRPTAGDCDIAENCTGSLAACPNDTFASATTICRGSAGICDMTEYCTGSSVDCPIDRFNSTATVCRASAGTCDIAEVCNGTSDCPDDSFNNSTTLCRASAGTCDIAENCTGSSAACPTDTFQASFTICRGSAGICDIAESCNGSSAFCPKDVFLNTSSMCRVSAGDCDIVENCSGLSANCPNDTLSGPSTICRSSVGICDIEENCTGSDAICPPDKFQLLSFVCRYAANLCDAEETCIGNNATCPTDVVKNSSTICRIANGTCDREEVCDGHNVYCPTDSYLNSSIMCRRINGTCDVPEFCGGLNGSCPVDVFMNSTIKCRSEAGKCDMPEYCSGSDAACPDDLMFSALTVCRSSAGICDIAENCTGNTAECPSDLFVDASTECRSSLGNCDPAEYCDGHSASCPSNILLGPETECRPIGGICDTQEYCTGTDVSCGPDVFVDAGVACRPSIGECDAEEQCTGTGPYCSSNTFLNSSQECRPARGLCDVAEACNGSSEHCPPDSYLDASHMCAEMLNECIPALFCNGSSNSCSMPYVLPCDKGTCNATSGYCVGYCGDRSCDAIEDCVNCPDDCPSPCDLCGDGNCNSSIGENCTSCFVDCLACSAQLCINGCHHGVCYTGICLCDDGYFGPTCNKSTLNVDDSHINGSAVNARANGTTFSLSIREVVEYSQTGDVLRRVNISELDFSNTNYNTSYSQVHIFDAVLPSANSKARSYPDAATLKVYISFFNTSTNVTFANETLYMAPNTFKVAISIFNWPFGSTKSTLSVVFENSLNNEVEDECDAQNYIDSNDNLRWVLFSAGDVSVYSKLVEFALVDGKKRYIRYSKVPGNYIAATIPFFWYNLTMDPHFGFLISDLTSPSCSRKSKLVRNRWQLYLAIPVGVCFVGLMALLFNYKRVQGLFMRQQKRLENECSLEIDLPDLEL